jgi:two-component system phosphate regulon response regulator PhoB
MSANLAQVHSLSTANTEGYVSASILETRHVLVVEDEKDLAELLTYNLRRTGYLVASAPTGLRALQAISERRPDLILLDIMLPELSGTEVASRIRSNPETASIPIIMLTAKGEEVDQLVGLTVGADDYVTKPFSMKVLLARVEAVLRRTTRTGDGPAIIQLGPVSVNMQTHEAFVDGNSIKLTLTEFRLLSSMLAANGRVLSRKTLMSRAMGPGVTVTERTIDVHVTAIRKKIGAHSAMIKTVRGVGYRATLEEGGDTE